MSTMLRRDPDVAPPTVPSGQLVLQAPPALAPHEGAGGALTTALPMVRSVGSIALVTAAQPDRRDRGCGCCPRASTWTGSRRWPRPIRRPTRGGSCPRTTTAAPARTLLRTYPGEVLRTRGVEAAGPSLQPLQPLVPLLAQARDVGLHLVVARRSGGASRALHEPVIQSLRDLAMPGVLLSGSPDEGPLLGTARPRPAGPGRAQLVTRDRGVEVVQTAWTEPSL